MTKPKVEMNRAILGDELYIHPKEDGVWIQCAYKKVTVQQIKKIIEDLQAVVEAYEK